MHLRAIKHMRPELGGVLTALKKILQRGTGELRATAGMLIQFYVITPIPVCVQRALRLCRVAHYGFAERPLTILLNRHF